MRLEENERSEITGARRAGSLQPRQLAVRGEGRRELSRAQRPRAVRAIFCARFCGVAAAARNRGRDPALALDGQKPGLAPGDHRHVGAFAFCHFCPAALFVRPLFRMTMARLKTTVCCVPGASILLAGAYACAAHRCWSIAGVGLAQICLRADFWMARGVCVLLGADGRGKFADPAAGDLPAPDQRQSRPPALRKPGRGRFLRSRESLFTTAAQTLDYQFGFKVSETWFFQACRKTCPCCCSPNWRCWRCPRRCFSSTRANKRCWNITARRRAFTARAPHFKLPWPVDRVYRYPAPNKSSPFAVGYTPDRAKRVGQHHHSGPCSHAKEEELRGRLQREPC